jgi:pimeloyl-ACP methyl ester carboxylesterase
MYAEKSVVRVHRDLKIHTTLYPNPRTSQTVNPVNGSLATSASFNQSVRYLQPLFNVVLFDQPYQGQSRQYNPAMAMIDKQDEALILLDLIDLFRADHVLAFSWGGVATLLALAQRPERIRSAVISSFSPVLNPAMQGYLDCAQQSLATCDRQAIGKLINETIGEHLPSLFKRCNFRHVSSLEEFEYAQMLLHVRQVRELDSAQYMSCVGNVKVPLLFVNGEWDHYTSPADARQFSKLAPQSEFATIAHTGHFLEMEHKTALQDVQGAVEGFLLRGRSTAGHARLAMAG